MLKKSGIILLLLFILCLAADIHADVKKESTTMLEFKGTLGMMMRMFGGGKPVKTVEYYKGNVYKSDTMDKKGKVENSQITDLDKELFITIDHKKKRYTQMTFDEWRDMLKKNMEKFKTQQETDKTEKDEEAPEVEWDVDLDVSKTGETETIAGKKAEEVILKLKISAKATEKDAETVQGDMIVTSSNWMTKNLKGQKEIDQFHKKLADKLGFLPQKGNMQQMIAGITKSNPQLADAMQELEKESKTLSGVAMKSHTVYETKQDAMQQADQQDSGESEIPKSMGGLLKGFGKKFAKSDKTDSDQNILFESTTEITKFEETPIRSTEFEVPAKYKLKKN